MKFSQKENLKILSNAPLECITIRMFDNHKCDLLPQNRQFIYRKPIKHITEQLKTKENQHKTLIFAGQNIIPCCKAALWRIFICNKFEYSCCYWIVKKDPFNMNF